jgi:hypothetical protein
MIGRRGALRGLLLPILAAPMALATQSASAKVPAHLWNSAEVFIGRSLEDQDPSDEIECPLFFTNGHFAHGVHTLDLSGLPNGPVLGSITHLDDVLHPDFSDSMAAEIATGSDGELYLLVAGEGTVSDATGYFTGVTRAIVRCKYKVALEGGLPLLIACVDCVCILVRK